MDFWALIDQQCQFNVLVRELLDKDGFGNYAANLVSGNRSEDIPCSDRHKQRASEFFSEEIIQRVASILANN